MDKGSLEVLVARGLSLEEIGRRFDRHPSTVAYWMKKYGLEAVNRDKHAAKGAIRVRRSSRSFMPGCRSRRSRTKVGRSKATVRHWLGALGLRTKNTPDGDPHQLRRRRRTTGSSRSRWTAVHHGATEFILEGRGYYRCKRCRSEGVARRRRKVKQMLVAEAGGCCVVCGYDRCLDGACVPPSRPEREAAGDQPERRRRCRSKRSRGGQEVRARVRKLPRGARERRRDAAGKVLEAAVRRE